MTISGLCKGWNISDNQKSLLLSQIVMRDFTERVPLSYACYGTFYRGTEKNG